MQNRRQVLLSMRQVHRGSVVRVDLSTCVFPSQGDRKGRSYLYMKQEPGYLRIVLLHSSMYQCLRRGACSSMLNNAVVVINCFQQERYPGKFAQTGSSDTRRRSW